MRVIESAARLGLGDFFWRVESTTGREFVFLLKCLEGMAGKLPRRAQARLVDDIRHLQSPTEKHEWKQIAASKGKEIAPDTGLQDREPDVEQELQKVLAATAVEEIAHQQLQREFLSALRDLQRMNPRLHRAVEDVLSRGGGTVTDVADAAGVSTKTVYEWLRPIRAAWLNSDIE